jgi:hypothetical protein
MENMPLNTIPSSDMMETVTRAGKQQQDMILSQKSSRQRRAILREGRKSNFQLVVKAGSDR